MKVNLLLKKIKEFFIECFSSNLNDHFFKSSRFYFFIYAFVGLITTTSWGQGTAIYSVSTTSSVSTSGTVPAGAAATYSQTYAAPKQITGGNSATLTLSGYAGYKITNIVLNMASNSSSGSGSLSVKVGTDEILAIPSSPFNSSNWNGAWANNAVSYVNITRTPIAREIVAGENVVILISASANSLYIGSYSVTYEPVTPCAGTPVPGNTIASVNPVASGSSTVLSMSGSFSGLGTTYQWQSSSDNVAWTNLGVTTSTLTQTITANKYYRCVVTCSGSSAASNSLLVNLDYCKPTYSTGPAAYDQITKVSIDAWSNSSGSSVSPFYTFYNAITIPNIQRATSCTVSVSFGTDANQYGGVWIDFNQNLIFEASEGFVSTSSAGASGTYQFIIPIPAGAILGNTRMRVRGGDDVSLSTTQACGASNSAYGESEDYSINIIETLPPTTYTWTGATNNSWINATNWSPNGIPGINDSVIISSPGTTTLVINDTRNIKNFTLTGTGNFTLNASGVLTINGDVTYGGTATATLNCNSMVKITSSNSQTIPPLNYGNLDVLGGNRVFLNSKTIGICSGFNVDQALYTYTVTGSTVNYFSNGLGWNMSSFNYHNLTFSGTSDFNIISNINVAGDFSQTAGNVKLDSGSQLNIVGNMNVTGGNFRLISGNVNLNGNLKVNSPGTLIGTAVGTSKFNFNGVGDGLSAATTQTIDVNVIPANIDFKINLSAYAKLINQNFRLGSGSKLTVATGGVLDFGFSPTNIALQLGESAANVASFVTNSASTLKITSPLGISTVTTQGNILIQNKTIHQDGYFHYIGNANQVTGSALPTATSAKKVIVELNSDSYELTPSNITRFNSSGILEIRKGIVQDNSTSFFADGTLTGELGKLQMSGGTYKFNDYVSTSSSTVYYPRLSGNYDLTGGLIDLAATTDTNTKYQILRGSKTYYNLQISGTSSNGGYKGISNAISVVNSLKITNASIFDTDSKSVNGVGNVNMDGGRWRISKLSSVQPELTGNYNLTGGTIEFYGSGATSNQTFKGGITYHNLDINATASNTNYSNLPQFFNVAPGTSFILNGTLTVNSPAVFRLDSSEFISGSGNVTINSGATLLYGSINGIKTSGTTTSDGAIRISGTRTFSSNASYGFIGGIGNIVSGNGLPATVENLFVAKSNTLDNIALSSSVTIKNKLFFIGGNIITSGNTLELGTDASNLGTLQYTSGFVKGPMTRWFNNANTGDASGLFPLGTVDNKVKFAKVEFQSTTTPGKLTASIIASEMGTAGITTLGSIPAVGSCAAFSVIGTDNSYWNLTPQSLNGYYSAYFTKEAVLGDNACEIALLNRATTNWTSLATHFPTTAASVLLTAGRSNLNTFNDFGFGSKRCGETKTWNGSVWVGGIPSLSNKVVFSGNYNSSLNGGAVAACSCEIASGVTVTIAGGSTPNYLEIQNELTNNGTLIVQNNASLIQYNDESLNNGNLKMFRDTQPVFRYDYTYWSSPVHQQSLHAVSPTTLYDKYYSWNAASNPQAWQLHPRPLVWDPLATPAATDIMLPGKGYIIRAPQTFLIENGANLPTIYQAIFEGVPNNGLVNVPITGGADKYNLIGNPYPSAISADAFLSHTNNTGVVGGTIYLWTHNSPVALIGGDATYNYTASDYAVYNLTGSTATSPGGNSGGQYNNPALPEGYIASGQSFFIEGSSSGGNAIFNNAMRTKGNNSQFFRNSNSQNLTNFTSDRNRIWLNASNTSGAFCQTLVGYLPNATNGWDREFDGRVFGGNAVSLYSITDEENLTIQGRTLPFDVNDKVTLGYKATAAENLTIAIDHFDGLFSGQNIYLEDKLLNIIHDLKQAPYHFSTLVGTFNQRFVLRYTNESLGMPDFAANANEVIIAVKDKNLKVVSIKKNIKNITVFDLLGRKIFQKNDIHELNFSTHDITVAAQVLIVKVVLEDNSESNQKIIFK